jgi:hypothetical protein
MFRLRFPILTAAFAGLASMIILASPARAEIISGWDFSPIVSGGNWGDSPMTATTRSPNANDLVDGLTRGWTVGSGTSAAAAWGGNNFSITATTEAAAIAANNFATFTVTADPGYTLSLSDIAAYNIRHSATGPSTGIWQYKVDSGSFTDIGSAISWGSVTTAAGNPESAINLSGISDLQNIAAGTTVTLRCVTWGATNVGGTWYFNDPSKTTANDLVVEGTLTVVPEPGALIVLAMGGLCLLPFIRRK